jgi:hypothetical protein
MTQNKKSPSDLEYESRWQYILQKDLPKEKPKSDYQDVLSTEDCVLDALESFKTNNAGIAQ